MLKIKLQRVGRRNVPRYRLVVQSTNRPRRSGYIALIGNYDPFRKNLILNHKILKKYLRNHITLTQTVKFLLFQQTIKVESKKILKLR